MIKLITLGFLLFSSSTNAQQTFNKLNANELVVTSTTKASKPCPAMTETQRNAIASPVNGFCIYNTTTSKLNVYNGTIWKAAGGGVDNWGTGTVYAVNDIVIESSKIYQCLIAHTSGTFETDLAASRWVEISSTVPVNLTGPITSVGNATSIASQTGTGSTFVVQNTPTLTTPNIGAATGTSLTLAGNISAYNYDKDNLLINGNIENPLSSEWTCTVGTCTRTTTAGQFSKDTAALSVALSAQAMNVSQTVTTPSGIQKQGFVRVIYRVPATMADFQICSLVDGVEQNCIPTANLIKDDTFRPAEIPLTFGSTSAGIKFKTTSSYTANAYFDGAVLAQGLGTQNLQGDTVYTARISSGGIVSRENKDWINGNAAITSTSRFAMTFNTGIFTATPNCVATVETSGAVRICSEILDTTSLTQAAVRTFTCSDNNAVAESFSISCQKSGNDYLAASSNVYASQNANFSGRNDGVMTVQATSVNPTKGTIVTDRIISARFGNRLLASYQYEQSAGGTSGTGDYLYTLPAGLSFDSNEVFFFTGNNIAQAGPKSFVGYGRFADNATQIGGVQLLAYDATRFRVMIVTNSSAIFQSNAAGGFNVATIGLNLVIDAPISGWSNSNVIVGSFAGIETCNASTNECDDTFSAKIQTTSGTVTDENVDWITSCTAANPTVCTFKSGIFTVAPNCSVMNREAGGATVLVNASATSSSSFSFNSILTTTGAATASVNFMVTCQKQGVDYKPKTAKVASSIGVPTVSGATTQAYDTFAFTFGTTTGTTVCSASPCSFLDQIGNSVSSVTRSGAGDYVANLSKTYTKVKCSLTSLGASATAPYTEMLTGSTYRLQTYNSSSTRIDTYGTAYCIGEY